MKYNKQDKETSNAVRKRADGYCEICGNYGIDNHHLFKRGYIKVRFDLDNCTWLCRRCHQIAEKSPAKFKDWFIKVKGIDAYNRLKELTK